MRHNLFMVVRGECIKTAPVFMWSGESFVCVPKFGPFVKLTFYFLGDEEYKTKTMF